MVSWLSLGELENKGIPFSMVFHGWNARRARVDESRRASSAHRPGLNVFVLWINEIDGVLKSHYDMSCMYLLLS